eukprot:4939647-Ditylum_brightwellii.AAC.1
MVYTIGELVWVKHSHCGSWHRATIVMITNDDKEYFDTFMGFYIRAHTRFVHNADMGGGL